MDWKKLKKIDAHVHLLPQENLSWQEGEWKQADVRLHAKLMERYHVEQAVLVPINDRETFYPDCGYPFPGRFPKCSICLQLNTQIIPCQFICILGNFLH